MMPFEPVVAVEQITPEWLTQVLTHAGRLRGARVASVQRETCGTGQLGDSYRFTLTYDPPSSGPATLVGKFASKDPTSREFGSRSGYYRSEIGFYTDLAPQLAMSIPTAVHAALADNVTDFVLLMEDLAPARQVDQLLGCDADESARVLTQAAALHAASWHDRKLAALDWLQGPVGIFGQVTDNFAGVLKTFPDLCADLVPDADLAVAAGLIDHAAAWKGVFSEPRCLWHSDLRADNVLFDAVGGTRPVVVLDWQGLGFGCGSIDIAYWMGTSMTVEQRRVHERALVQHYHRELVGLGVSGYSAERCWDDYRLHAIHGLQVGVFGLGAVKRTPRGDRMWKLWIERTAAQVRDLDSFEVLGRIG
ncbi:phosphotransferase [Panacagrimonas sp.]|uniref:phosphotransferase n=1 Tax=Panacagrimonas sp. TaxID=2480088 RepID=UPI003B524DA9